MNNYVEEQYLKDSPHDSLSETPKNMEFVDLTKTFSASLDKNSLFNYNHKHFRNIENKSVNETTNENNSPCNIYDASEIIT